MAKGSGHSAWRLWRRAAAISRSTDARPMLLYVAERLEPRLLLNGASFDLPPEYGAGYKPIATHHAHKTITVTLPAGAWEGQTLSNAGTVQIGRTLPKALIVNLSSSDTTALMVPASVSIPAGQTSVTFSLTFLTDANKEGSRTETVTARARGLTTGSSKLTLQDSNLDYVAIDAITSPETAGTAFVAAAHAYNIANEVIAVYGAGGTLSAAGQAGNLPVTPSSITFAAGVWSGNVTLTTADPTVNLTATTGGVPGTSNTFVVQAGALSSFIWGTVSNPQIAGMPFAETLTATDANGNIVGGFSGTATLSGLIPTTTSQTMLGNLAYPSSANIGLGFTDGYAFTPNSILQVTSVRSYYGNKVSIWTDTGTLLVNQYVSGPLGTWTETPLPAPLTLVAGTTYRIGLYTTGTWYFGSTAPPNPAFATLGQSYNVVGDGFPAFTGGGWWPVDIRADVPSSVPVSLTPTTATLTNGLWSGSITVTQTAVGMHLHADDGAGHGGDSATFTVVGPPQSPDLLAATDSGLYSDDNLTNFNNSSWSTALKFSVGGTLNGAIVTIYADGVAIGSAFATDSTTTVVTDGITTLMDGVHSITARQTLSGAPETADSPALSITIDTTGPSAIVGTLPPVTTAGGTSYTFTITYSDNTAIDVSSVAKLSVFVTGSGSLENATLVSVDNNTNGTPRTATYRITPPGGSWSATANGLQTISLPPQELRDTAGNFALNFVVVGTFSVFIPPGPPAAPILLAISDSGVSPSDDITNVNGSTNGILGFSVGNVVPGATVTIYADGIPIGSRATTGKTISVFTNGTTTLADGVHSITARQLLSGLPQSADSPPLAITIDTTPPAIPSVPRLEASSDSGISSTDGVTNIKTPTFDVTTSEGGVIHLDYDGTSGPTLLVPSAGTYALTLPGTSTFLSSKKYIPGNSATFVATGDFNSDGKPDFVVSTSSGLAIFLNKGDGTFKLPTVITAIGGRPVIADFNGDGKLDIATPYGVILGNGDGTFSSPISWNLPRNYFATSLVSGDFNGDGIPDVAVGISISDGSPPAIAVFLGKGDGTFQSPKITMLNSVASDMATGDFNSDGKEDIVATTNSGNTPIAQVLLGNGDGTFSLGTPLNTLSTVTREVGVTTGDFNGDGKTDIAVGEGVLSIFLGNGDGTFQPRLDSTGLSDAQFVVAGDFNHDGKLDLATSRYGTPFEGAGLVFVAYGNGDGTLQRAQEYLVDSPAEGIAAADFNGDGRPDLVTADPYQGEASVLLSSVISLADGPHNVVAWMEDRAGNKSPKTAALPFTLDTAAPIATVASVPSPRSAPVDSVTITFNKPVYNFSITDLKLSLNGGANLLTAAQTLSTTDQSTWVLGNLSSVTTAAGNYNLSLAASLTVSDQAGNAPTSVGTTWVTTGASVAGRFIFYNDSYWNDPANGFTDDNAIDPTKTALLPGQAAGLASYTGSAMGINGVMVDVLNLPPGTPTASDFSFKVGNDNSPGGWATAPAPTSVTVDRGFGVGGSDRIELAWPDNAIQNEWLQVTVNADAATGLVSPDVFYFGNEIGKSDADITTAVVSGSDLIAVRDHPASFVNRALPSNPYDFNHDSFVDATDLIITRENLNNFLTALKLITAPAGTTAPAAAPSVAPSLLMAASRSSAMLPSSKPLTLTLSPSTGRGDTGVFSGRPLVVVGREVEGPESLLLGSSRGRVFGSRRKHVRW